jgi:hypothetical protein
VATFNHSTRAQLADRLRERFRTASGSEAAKIARFFSGLTDNQLRAAFSMTAAQVTNLRTRLNAITTKADTLKAVAGE